MSFYSTIKKKSSHISFHTPGHNNSLNGDLISCDTTELSYSDNLLNPTDIIKTLQEKLASAYNAKASFISTNGATNSILSCLYAVKNLGDLLIVGVAHKSIYNACRLFNITAYHIDSFVPELIPQSVKSIIITTPNYYGDTLDIEQIASISHSKDMLLLVDASHGSHFEFSSLLPLSATKYADMVVHSLHKTLPVLTGGSVLCVCNNVLVDSVIMSVRLLHSTSPSYPIMCSIDLAISDFTKNGESYYQNIKEAISNFATRLNKNFSIEKNNDFTRLVITTKYAGCDISDHLETKNIYAEMSYANKIVFIVTNYNFQNLIYLAEVLNNIDLSKYAPYDFIDLPLKEHKTPALLTFGQNFELLPLEKSIGKYTYNEIGFYPPGVPFLYSNTLITEQHILLLKKHHNRCFGLVNGCVCVVK